MRKRNLALLTLVSMIVLTLFGVTAVGASVPVAHSQNWLLDSANHSLTGKKMIREGRGTPTGSLSIANGASQLWLADEAAQADVTFPGGAWIVVLDTPQDWSSSCQAEVGYVDSLLAFTKFNTYTGAKTYLAGIMTVEVQLNSVTVPTGKYLAIKVGNSSGQQQTVVTTGASHVTSPTTDPGYPLPELAAGILLGAGLVGLGGFMVVRKKAARSLAAG